MTLYVVFRRTKSDEEELDSIFIKEENMERYLSEIELIQDEWESKNISFSMRVLKTED